MTVQSGRDLTADLERGCDVCIVGSGAGGSVLAAGLCARGLNVVMVEEGSYYKAKDFDLEERHAYERMYQDRGLRTTSDGAVIVLQGRTVGGGTQVNWTTCFRTPDATLELWRDRFGIDGLSPTDLLPHFEAVEKRLSIAQWSETLANANNQVLLRGCRKLGYQVAPLRRNVFRCRDSGYCGVGCAWDAKQSMPLTYLKDALEDGLLLLTDVKAEHIVMNHHSAGLVECVALEGETDRKTAHRVRIRPRVLVVAGGAINTPALLLRSHLDPTGLVGKRTFLHPTIVMTGRYRDSVEGWSGAPQSVGSHHFFLRDKEVGYFLETPPLQPVLASAAMSAFGADQLVFMQNLSHVSGIIALLVDGWHDDGGTIRLGPGGRPIVDYPFAPSLTKAMKDAMVTMARIHLAAGASTILSLHGTPIQVSTEGDIKRLEAASYGPHEHVIFTAHQMGGCAMGADPHWSVTDPQHRLRGTDNVFVVDGSVFPTSLGVNPSETIYAMAHRAVPFVADAV